MSMHSDNRHSPNSWALEAIRSNPEGLLLLAAGCALLMRGAGSPRRQTSGPRARSVDAETRRDSGARSVGERLSETAQSAGDFVTDVGGRVAETASNYASTVSDYADNIARGAAEQTGRIAQEAQSTLQDTISRVVQEQPLVVALAGAAAGAAVAAAFPVTEFENRTLGTTGKHLRQAAGEAGEHLKEATSQAGKRLAAAADERGLNAEGLMDVARDVGDAFSSALEGDSTNQTRTRAPLKSAQVASNNNSNPKR
jgi:hypothetical protein